MLRALELEPVAPDASYFLSTANLQPASFYGNSARAAQ
jgi:hypothetical protein